MEARLRSVGGDSRGSLRARWDELGKQGRLALAAGLLGGLLLILAETTVIAYVETVETSCEVVNDFDPALADSCELSGFERHGGALLLLGILAGALALAGARATGGAARAIGSALLTIGLLVLGIALLGDLPQTRGSGPIGDSLRGATF